MYVCLCNGVTDSQLVEAAVESASESGGTNFSAERVADRLGAGLGCGTCREFAVELVRRAGTRSASVVLPAASVTRIMGQPGPQLEPSFRPGSMNGEGTVAR